MCFSCEKFIGYFCLGILSLLFGCSSVRVHHLHHQLQLQHSQFAYSISQLSLNAQAEA